MKYIFHRNTTLRISPSMAAEEIRLHFQSLRPDKIQKSSLNWQRKVFTENEKSPKSCIISFDKSFWESKAKISPGIIHGQERKIKECWKFSGVPPAGVAGGKFNVKSGESKSIGGGRGTMTLKEKTKMGCFIISYSMYVLHGDAFYPAIPRINKVKYSAIPYNALWYPTIPCDITNYIFQLHIFHFLISIWLWGCQEWRWERWRRGGHGQTLALQWWWWWSIYNGEVCVCVCVCHEKVTKFVWPPPSNFFVQIFFFKYFSNLFL